MSYQFCKEDVFNFAHSMNYETEQKGSELRFKYCPYCQGGSGGKDKYTFSINLETGAFGCFRASCDHKGHFVELCRDFDFPLNMEAPKVYKKMPQKKVEAADIAIQYLGKRGISKEIVQKYQIGVRKDQPKTIVFPFYDEDGTLVFAKYRNTAYKKGDKGSKEYSEAGTMPILFGMNHCKGFDRLIITEGQIDSLSVAEAGFDNAVSVPTGAAGFTWLTHNRIWITKFKEIIVFGDCEHGKITLLDTLIARLPKDIIIKAVRIKDYLGEKDANDILCKYGKKAVQVCIENAEIPFLDNVKDLADVQDVDINCIDKIETGIYTLDQTIRGMAMGQLVILTGKRGEGKSTVMSQIVANALEQKRNIFVYSGELADFHFKRWLNYQLAGTANIEEQANRKWGDNDYSLKPGVAENISKWYRGRAYIYDNTYIADGKEMESLPGTIERAIQQYNVEFICIDNLMTAMERVTDQSNLYLAQSNFVGQLKAIAMKYCVVILLVAHPKKGGEGYQDDNELIAGSSDITNKADIILRYERVDNAEDGSNGRIKVTKNRIMGVLRTTRDSAVKTYYSPISKRVIDIRDIDDKEIVYGWEKNTDDFQKISSKDELPF